MKPSRRVFVSLCTALILTVTGVGASPARDKDDHDRARKALEAGEILPLRKILERVERDTPGQVIDVELERKDGRWIYEVKVLRADSSLINLKVDARDGTVVGSRKR